MWFWIICTMFMNRMLIFRCGLSGRRGRVLFGKLPPHLLGWREVWELGLICDIVGIIVLRCIMPRGIMRARSRDTGQEWRVWQRSRILILMRRLGDRHWDWMMIERRHESCTGRIWYCELCTLMGCPATSVKLVWTIVNIYRHHNEASLWLRSCLPAQVHRRESAAA
jgi:hypothetical protein